MRKTFLLAAILLVSCGGEAITADLSATAGIYTLRSENGNPLPYTLVNQTNLQITVLAETLELTAQGAFQDISRITQVSNGITTTIADTAAGSWSLSGVNATLSPNDGSPTILARIVGSTLTISGTDFSGQVLVATYTK
jgi:hypothetical protein